MIWIASFPRSGNTFLRNILFEVYGIASGSLPLELFNTNPNESYAFTKTHLLPSDIPELSPEDKVIYIVRNGMDALISLAHYRKDLLEPHTSFENNLLECIIAPGGSHFGGWSENVRQWKERADVLIRFENLITQPLEELEKIKSIYPLPKAQINKLPTFEDLKFGQPKYAPAGPIGGNQAFFRKGKIGEGKREMPSALLPLFETIHGNMMSVLGYSNQKKTFSSKKKILIDATKLRQAQKDGTQRYLEELLGAMRFIEGAKPQSDLAIDLFVGWGVIVPLIAPEDKGKAIKPSRLYKFFKRILYWRSRLEDSFLWQCFALVYYKLPFYKWFKRIHQYLADTPSRKLLEQYDLVHIPLPQHTPFYKNSNNKLLVTIHDLSHLLFPTYHTAENIALAEQGMAIAKEKNAAYIAISKSTKSDFQSHYQLDSERLHLIYEAVNHNFFKATIDKKTIATSLKKYEIPKRPFLFCLSTLEPRKNLKNTILAFQALYDDSLIDVALVIGGGIGWKEEDLFKDIQFENYPIYFTGHIEEQDLPVFYTAALAFCYVSHYEGFGLPILEAMSCSTAVIAGKNSSMLEILGKGGLLADAKEIADIKSKMKLLISKDELRKTLEIEALKQAHRFSWLKTAWQTIECYSKID